MNLNQLKDNTFMAKNNTDMDNKVKHLEFIQGIINRHNSNSFLIKGWTITISAALFALAGTIKEPELVFLVLVPIIMFWGLDAFYLSNERCFIDLYSAVAKGKYNIPANALFKKNKKKEGVEFDEGTIALFDMNFKKFKKWKNNKWFFVLWSKTIFWFYFPMITITISIMLLLSLFLTKNPDTIEVNAHLKPNKLQIEIMDKPELKVELIDTIKILNNQKQITK